MKRLKTTLVMVVALLAGTGLATAADARERERGGGHGAERVARHVVSAHLERARHAVRHDRYRKHGHGYGHYRHHAGPRHGRHGHKGKPRFKGEPHYRGKHRYRPHRGYAPHRSYRHRYRHHGLRTHSYGIAFELDGVRYFLRGFERR